MMSKICVLLLGVSLAFAQQCKEMEKARDQFLTQEDCLKEAGFQSVKEVTPEKMDCYGKCLYTKKGIFDDQGKPMKDAIPTALNVEMTDQQKTDIGKKIETCLNDMSGSIKVDDCASYKGFCDCADMAFKDQPCRRR